MSNALGAYSTLHYNPFLLAPLLVAFYANRKRPKKNEFLLSYVVLPLTLHPSSRGFLANSLSTSSLRTFCSKNERLYAFPERLTEFRELTNRCMQRAVDAGDLKILPSLEIQVLKQSMDKGACPEKSIRAAEKLATLIEELDVFAVYRFLGVHSL